MDSTNRSISVLMFPWLAHGHISPFLELGKKLNQRNFNIYLCSTRANLSSIEKKIGEFSIQLVELELPTSPDFPAPYHTTNGLPPHLMDTLKRVFDSARSRTNFSDILETLKPDLLIYDFLRPWPAEAASEQNIPAVQFIATSATMASYMLHAFKDPDSEFPFSKIYFRDYEVDHVTLMRESVENRLVMKSLEKSTRIVLIKGFKEMEGKYSNYLSRLSGKKVVHVGPLVQDPVDEEEDLEILQWLNKKKECSTIFVSFGSEYFLSTEDFEEIAHGLLLSDVNFIWVVRFPVGQNTRVEEELPLGFLERVGNKGLVVEGWAPQAKILGHASIGGFVSHCGWNSVIESMNFGVPIIAMPMHLDQPINARLVQTVGAGVEVLRTEKGKLEREKIAAVIKQVVLRKSGRFVRKKAKELSDSIREKGDEEIDEVKKELEELVQLYRLKRNGRAYSI